ncbi:hypothetical protein TSMEX_006359 [Taenia solium]|eukprot:TsM_001076500 transcript=TsM_001076500 gene=TsM_001076500
MAQSHIKRFSSSLAEEVADLVQADARSAGDVTTLNNADCMTTFSSRNFAPQIAGASLANELQPMSLAIPEA